MPEVITPPVHVLDFGYQAPNPVDYARSGSMIMQPFAEAVQRGNEAKNAFLLQQAKLQQDMALLQSQHQMAIQREQMRNETNLSMMKMRNQAVLDAVRQKQGSSMLAGALDTLMNRLGGDPPEGDPTDPAYYNKVMSAIAERKAYATQSDAKAYASLLLRRNAFQKQHDDAANSPEYKQLLSVAAKNTEASAMTSAQQKVLENRPDVAALVEAGTPFLDAVKKTPGAVEELNQTFRGYHQALQGQWLHQNGSLSGGAAERLAVLKDNLADLNSQMKELSMMPGKNGKVPKPWFSDSMNLGSDEKFQRTAFPDYFKSVDATKPAAPAAVPPPAPAPAANPFVPPTPTAFQSEGVGGWVKENLVPPVGLLADKDAWSGLWNIDKQLFTGQPKNQAGGQEAGAWSPFIAAPTPEELRQADFQRKTRLAFAGRLDPLGRVIPLPLPTNNVTVPAPAQVAQQPPQVILPPPVPGVSVNPMTGYFAPPMPVAQDPDSVGAAYDAMLMRSIYAPQ